MTQPAAGRTYVGAYGLCVRDGSILLVRIRASAPDGGMWTLPGGGVEYGEDPNLTLRREVMEETGLDAVSATPLAIYSKTYERSELPPHHPVQHIGIVFAMEAAGESLRMETDGSTDLCRWVPLAEARQLPLVPLAEFGLDLLTIRST